jgi:hypothetical protein
MCSEYSLNIKLKSRSEALEALGLSSYLDQNKLLIVDVLNKTFIYSANLKMNSILLDHYLRDQALIVSVIISETSLIRIL